MPFSCVGVHGCVVVQHRALVDIEHARDGASRLPPVVPLVGASDAQGIGGADPPRQASRDTARHQICVSDMRILDASGFYLRYSVIYE